MNKMYASMLVLIQESEPMALSLSY